MVMFNLFGLAVASAAAPSPTARRAASVEELFSPVIQIVTGRWSGQPVYLYIPAGPS